MSRHTRFSALHHAALGGSLELIALLLEAQATVDIKDSNGETPGCSLATPCGQSLLCHIPAVLIHRIASLVLFHLHGLLGSWGWF